MATMQLLSLAGWYFLPDLATGYTQAALYSIFIRAGDPKPAVGTARFGRDRRNIRIAFIVAYLLYTLYEADHELQENGDFYRVLGVSHNATDKAIQQRFRRLTVQYHPDKAGGADKSTVESVYVQIKLAKDTLVDPVKRFAYDRFGPDHLAWPNCKLMKDYIFSGLQLLMGYYVGTSAVLILLGVLGYLREGMYWRFLVIASMFMIEMHTVTRPYFPPVLAKVVNPVMAFTGIRTPYLPFQMIILLRKIAITFFVAMSQLGPLLYETATGEGSDVSPQVLDRVDAITKATEVEIARLMALELTPYAFDMSVAKELRGSLQEWIVQNTIRNDPELKMVIQRTLDKRRVE